MQAHLPDPRLQVVRPPHNAAAGGAAAAARELAHVVHREGRVVGRDLLPLPDRPTWRLGEGRHAVCEAL